jgi:uncharacterized phage protein gp47/JayE
MAGLTVEGFTRKTLGEIQADLEESFKQEFGENIDLGPKSAFGVLIGILSDALASLWEVAEAVDASQDPDEATGDSLEGLCALTGTFREAATPSTVTLTATGTPGTVLALARVASVVTLGTRFETTVQVTLLTLPAWAPTTGYVVGQRVFNGSRAYQCTVAGTSAGSGGPTGTGSAITDGTVTWRYLGEGTGAVDVAAEAQETGPQNAVAGSISVIETPVSGWQTVVNLLDANPGTDQETDEELRIRRAVELVAGALHSLDAILEEVLDVEDVESATIFVNDTDVTNGDGMPPHSVEGVVRGGAEADIREALFRTVCQGIQTHGGVSGTVTDSQGIVRTVKFSRPTEKLIYVTVDVIKDPDVFPSDGADQIEAAIVKHGNAQPTGKDVVSSRIKAEVFTIAGVLDVTAAKIGLSASPTLETTIAIAPREQQVHDTSRITVNLSNGVP